MSDKQTKQPSARTVGATTPAASAIAPWLRPVPGPPPAPPSLPLALPQDRPPGPDPNAWLVWTAILVFFLGTFTGLLSAVVGMRAKPPTYIYVQYPCDQRTDPSCPLSP